MIDTLLGFAITEIMGVPLVWIKKVQAELRQKGHRRFRISTALTAGNPEREGNN
jgi:hypothetical protein